MCKRLSPCDWVGLIYFLNYYYYEGEDHLHLSNVYFDIQRSSKRERSLIPGGSCGGLLRAGLNKLRGWMREDGDRDGGGDKLSHMVSDD